MNIFKKVWKFLNPVDYNSYDSIREYCKNSSRLEYAFEEFDYQSDVLPRDHWKIPEQFVADGGGDCEDFAIIVYLILRSHGFETKIYKAWNKNSAHAICWFKKGRDEGIFSNHRRTYYKNFRIQEDYVEPSKYTSHRVIDDWTKERRV